MPDTEVFIYGQRDDCATIVAELPDAVCVEASCAVADLSTAYDCLAEDAARRTRAPFLMHANDDLVFTADLLPAIEYVADLHRDFLIVGRLRDVAFTSDDAQLRDPPAGATRLHPPYAVEYSVQRTQLARSLGTPTADWDASLLRQYYGVRGAVVVDATSCVAVLHMLRDLSATSSAASAADAAESASAASGWSRPAAVAAAHLRLVSASAPGSVCPDCRLEPSERPFEEALRAAADPDTRDLLVATVNSGYVDFALNFKCSLDRVGLKNYIFHAVDRPMYDRLVDLGLPALLYESALSARFLAQMAMSESAGSDSIAAQPAFDYGSVAYQAVMNSRTELVYRVLQRGYHVLLSDVDVVLLRNPFPLFDRSQDVQGGVHKRLLLTGGFLYLRSTAATLRVWLAVVQNHGKMFSRMQTLAKYDPHGLTEQVLLNTALKSDPDVRWARLNESFVADGDRFFIKHETQQRGEWPVAIHNNYVVGVGNKRERFVNASLWRIDDQLACTPFVRPSRTDPPAGPLSLTIKVLAYNRPIPLARLLASLLALRVPERDVVPLEILVDGLASQDARSLETVDDRREAIRVAQAFQWPYGPVTVTVRPENLGLRGQWISAWAPSSDTELAWILEDDLVVSPLAYSFIMATARATLSDRSQFDPHLFGIALQEQHVIPGRYPTRPAQLLAPGTRWFRYQLLSTWGPVFFPRPWSRFLAWYHRAMAKAAFEPLVSNLVTNTWYAQRHPSSVWSVWFIRFAAEMGLYSLYTNFPEGALVINYRDKGVNFGSDLGPNGQLFSGTSIASLTAPPLIAMPLYDFHFNLIRENDAAVLEGRGLYADIWNVMLH